MNKCEFCNKDFSTKNILIKHQKTAKYCLKIQNADNSTIINTDNIFTCEFCKKVSTRKYIHDNHIEKCITRIKALYSNIKNEVKVLKLENEKLKLKTQRLEIENELFRKDREIINNMAQQPKNTTQNNKIIFTTSLDLSKGQLSSIIDDNLSEEHLTMGQKGIAHFAYNNFLKDGEGNLKYVCTDPSRQIFQFKNKEGDLEKDVRASKLTKALCDADIKQKSHQILSEYVMNGEESITTEYIKHYQNIRDMESDNSDFSKELTSLVV
jgi:hypothetical protein